MASPAVPGQNQLEPIQHRACGCLESEGRVDHDEPAPAHAFIVSRLRDSDFELQNLAYTGLNQAALEGADGDRFHQRVPQCINTSGETPVRLGEPLQQAVEFA